MDADEHGLKAGTSSPRPLLPWGRKGREGRIAHMEDLKDFFPHLRTLTYNSLPEEEYGLGLEDGRRRVFSCGRLQGEIYRGREESGGWGQMLQPNRAGEVALRGQDWQWPASPRLIVQSRVSDTQTD